MKHLRSLGRVVDRVLLCRHPVGMALMFFVAGTVAWLTAGFVGVDSLVVLRKRGG